MEFILDCLKDAAVDTVKLVPFLFVTYLAMEYLEDRAGEKSETALERAGRFGPVIGGVIGIVPQCGFSAAAASLYSGGVITVGTLLAVFLSTSDEMLPLMISEAVPAGSVGKILLAKAVMGVITGLAVDAILKAIGIRRTEKHIHDLCEQAHCGCDDEEEHGILMPALRHTIQIVIFIFIISFAITLLVEGIGEDAVGGFLTKRPVTGVLLAGIVGLIPNCASSVMLTELYLNELLSAGQMMAGLMVGAGVGLLVLFRTNRHMKDNLRITLLLYLTGIAWGLIIEAAGITF